MWQPSISQPTISRQGKFGNFNLPENISEIMNGLNTLHTYFIEQKNNYMD